MIKHMIIPANPGYEVLFAFLSRDEREVADITRVPVVAWRIDLENNCTPEPIIADDGLVNETSYLKCPTGVVISIDRVYTSEDEWRRAEATIKAAKAKPYRELYSVAAK